MLKCTKFRDIADVGPATHSASFSSSPNQLEKEKEKGRHLLSTSYLIRHVAHQ